ncbi:HIT domain-containing protein [Synechococcus sp. CCY9202]|nr:HIT domain-containing protein [Synechococcus sp. CCY9202]MEA5423551.1 HIT domain-containing protein [Synechococcus sp. CCY9202]
MADLRVDGDAPKLVCHDGGVQACYGHHEAGCVFCEPESSGRVLLENKLALCIADTYPVSEGHSLVIPRRHLVDGMAHSNGNASARAGQSSLSRILARASTLADPSTLFSTTWTINSMGVFSARP